MNKKALNIGIIIIALVFIGLLMVPAVLNRVNNDTDEVQLKAATEAFEDNKTHNFIPGTMGYYYIGFTTDSNVVIVKASPEWFNDNFTKDGYSKEESGTTVKGCVTAIPDNLVDDADSIFKDMETFGWKDFKYNKESYLNTHSDSFFVKAIIASVLTVIITALIVIGVAKDWYDSKYMILLLIVMVVVLVYFGLHIILGR